jgi:hypothetical protein
VPTIIISDKNKNDKKVSSDKKDIKKSVADKTPDKGFEEVDQSLKVFFDVILISF